MNDIGEIVECTSCGMTYRPAVLTQKLSKPQPDAARYLNSIKERLDKGFPVEYVISDLTLDGLDRDVATNMVNMMLGGKTRQCPQCQLTYAASVSLCRECNIALDPPQI